MRLLEAIIDANHRALAGDQTAGLHPAEFEAELPLVALTCIDSRLNPLMPQVLGVPAEQFIWLRNAGNVITGPLSSTIRSLSLACAVKGGKEIVIVGHTDCLIGKTTTMQLLEKLKALGIERHLLPENINEYFGISASERQNVIRAVEFARRSPLIGPKTPIHGLLVDIETGKLEWIVNGYQDLDNLGTRWHEVVKSAGQTMESLKSLTDFKIGEMKISNTKIGETVTKMEDWVAQKIHLVEPKTDQPAPPPKPEPKVAAPPPIPLPPPLRPRVQFRKGLK